MKHDVGRSVAGRDGRTDVIPPRTICVAESSPDIAGGLLTMSEHQNQRHPLTDRTHAIPLAQLLNKNTSPSLITRGDPVQPCHQPHLGTINLPCASSPLDNLCSPALEVGTDISGVTDDLALHNQFRIRSARTCGRGACDVGVDAAAVSPLHARGSADDGFYVHPGVRGVWPGLVYATCV